MESPGTTGHVSESQTYSLEGQMKVLVVDDSKAMRRIIKQSFRDLGFDSDEAENGLRALEVLESKPTDYSLILVDWNMPEMNGYEFVCEVRKRDEFSELSILMVTTENEVEQMLKALDAGANEYLMKPFTKDALLDKLELLGVATGRESS